MMLFGGKGRPLPPFNPERATPAEHYFRRRLDDAYERLARINAILAERPPLTPSSVDAAPPAR